LPLLGLLLLLSVLYYHNTIGLPPSYIHSWTQSDRYAISLKFLENGFNFFKPQTFNLSTIDGITGVDFPLHEYLVALIMKITGSSSPVIFRAIHTGDCFYWILLPVPDCMEFFTIKNA
jgi:hypothetical protein